MQFDEDFFTAIGLADAPEADKQKVAEDLAELIQSRVANRLGDVLTNEQGEHFANLLDEGKDVEAFEYLSEVYPEYGQIVQEEVDRARDELLNDMQTAIKIFDEKDAAAQGQAEVQPGDTGPTAEPIDEPQPAVEQPQPDHHVQHPDS
jgi:hypothetical protein